MNSYEFFIYEFICFMNSYMNSCVPRFQMTQDDDESSPAAEVVVAVVVAVTNPKSCAQLLALHQERR